MRLRGPGEQTVAAQARDLARKLTGALRRDRELAPLVRILGPAPAGLAKLKGRFRWQMLIKSAGRPALRQTIKLVDSLWTPMARTQATLTLALKNPFGAISPKDRMRVHAEGTYEGVGEALADCFSVTLPHLNIIDAIVTMEGPGPTLGAARHVGVLVAALNAVAADHVMEHVVGMEETRRLMRLHGAAVLKITQDRVYIWRESRSIPVRKRTQS